MASTSGDPAPPYPSAARISDSPCYPQYSASLKCSSNDNSGKGTFTRIVKPKDINPPFLVLGLEEHSSEKSKCQEHFDVYKECKKKEREARLERNSKRSFFS